MKYVIQNFLLNNDNKPTLLPVTSNDGFETALQNHINILSGLSDFIVANRLRHFNIFRHEQRS